MCLYHYCGNVVYFVKMTFLIPYSKKDSTVRYKELLTMVSPPLLQYIVDHARDLVLENGSLLLVLSILNHAIGKCPYMQGR